MAAGPQSSADYDEEIQRMTDRYHNRYNEVILNAHEVNLADLDLSVHIGYHSVLWTPWIFILHMRGI